MPAYSQSKVVTIAALLSLAITVIPSVAICLLAELPDSVAVHWGVDGHADGYASPLGALIFPPLFMLIMGAVLLGIGAGTRTLQLLAPITVGIAAMLSILTSGTVLAQHGGGTPAIGPYLFAGTVALIGITLLGVWWLRDRMQHFPAELTGTFAEATPGHPDERAWHGRIRSSLTLWIFAGILTVVGIGVTIWFGIGDPWGGAAMGLLTLGCVPLILLTIQDVTIDEDGLTTRWFGRVRVLRFPLDEIVSAGSVHLDALGDYGGVGWRSSIDGRREGIVAGTGEALILQLEGRRDYVLSVDDAHRAARVLMALLQR